MRKPERFYYGGHEPAPKPYLYKECGLNNIYLMNGFTLEEVDGERYVSVQNVDGLWKAIGMRLVTTQKTFSPEEIRFLRARMNMTQAELARILRVDDQTVARWEKKKTRLPGPADVALRVLFLSSDVAKPEGAEILARLPMTLKDIVEQDAPVLDEMHFSKNQRSDAWEFRARLRLER